MITNNLLGIGYAGSLNVGPNAQGATLFVNSVTGNDNRGRVKFPGATASTSAGSQQGPQGDPAWPLASLAYALTLTAANRGDVIILQEGHVETLTANVTCSNAGVTILGLGNPDCRPNYTMAGFSIILSGAGCQLINILANVAAVANTAGVIQLTGAGSTCFGVKVLATQATTVGFVLGATHAILDTCEVDGTTTGLATGVLFGVFDLCQILNCNIHGIFANAPVVCVANTNMLISNTILRQLHATVAPVITGIVTATSGMITNCRFQSVYAATAAAYIGGANVATNILVIYLQNYGFTGKAGPSSGILIPAVGTIP